MKYLLNTGIVLFVILLSHMNAQKVSMKVGDNANILKNTLMITLKDNPTTGYGWYLTKYDHQCVSPKSYSTVMKNQSLIGAPGKIKFIFSVNKMFNRVPQTCLIVFKYMRIWENKTVNKVVFRVTSRPIHVERINKKHHISHTVHQNKVKATINMDQPSIPTKHKHISSNWLSLPDDH